jgi:alkylated DNA repair dioxygenase AlkB
MQLGLFGAGRPAFQADFSGIRRQRLDATAFFDHLPRWLSGHQQVFDTVRSTSAWQAKRRQMYDRTVDVPRLTCWYGRDGEAPSVLTGLSAALSTHYERPLTSLSAAYYRDGSDSVAWHGDRVGELVDDCLVAIVSVGEPRRFLIRSQQGGRSLTLSLGWGDLLVMGGSCQRDWQHAVPKCASAGPRISLMFREPQRASQATGSPDRPATSRSYR